MALLPVLNCQSSAKVLMLLLLVFVQIVWTEPVAKRSTSKSSSGGKFKIGVNVSESLISSEQK